MRATMMSVVAGAALLLVFTGCANSQKQSMAARNHGPAQVARSQSPSEGGYEEWCEEDECDDECRHCWGNGCCHCRPYRVPCNLRYPPAGQQPGIVQYPYYTCKGPDCFFAEPNPVRRQ
ncbi:MAG: hypothetical protein JSS02_26005 [Planctomycetes bacterium]|nr:hypothetical protein [Planctomycetota bacterium]